MSKKITEIFSETFFNKNVVLLVIKIKSLAALLREQTLKD